jgi:hypothetical protein
MNAAKGHAFYAMVQQIEDFISCKVNQIKNGAGSTIYAGCVNELHFHCGTQPY